MLAGPPDSAKEALKLWDSKLPVWTVEVGGFGPGYEQAIHVAVFELLRLTDCKLPPSSKKSSEVLDKLLQNIDRVKKLQLSGSQAAVAKHLAFLFIREGYKHTIEMHKNLPRIQVSRWFPGA